MTAIEWTQRPGTKGETWNPVVGCTPVSAGCLNCYAATMARRLEAMGRPEYVGLTKTRRTSVSELDGVPRTVAISVGKPMPPNRAVFTGEVRTLPWRLAEPLGWKRPRTVFVNSMSDLFHEAVPFEFIDQVFAVMALCPQHTFLVLTKRPERMAEYLNGKREQVLKDEPATATTAWHVWSKIGTEIVGKATWDAQPFMWAGFPHPGPGPRHVAGWPLPNVWLGTSVENQAAADERIPQLLECPAAVRFLSCEPLLGPVELQHGFRAEGGGARRRDYLQSPGSRCVHWVIAGGESGAQARPCDAAWLRSIVRQCRAARVPVFVKQLGARPMMNYYEASRWYEERGWDILDHRIFDGADGREWVPERDGQPSPTALLEIQNRRDDRKGGDPAEWPEDLRVREWPGAGANGQIANEDALGGKR